MNPARYELVNWDEGDLGAEFCDWSPSHELVPRTSSPVKDEDGNASLTFDKLRMTNPLYCPHPNLPPSMKARSSWKYAF